MMPWRYKRNRLWLVRVLPLLERLDRALDGLWIVVVVAAFAWFWLVLVWLALSP